MDSKQKGSLPENILSTGHLLPPRVGIQKRFTNYPNLQRNNHPTLAGSPKRLRNTRFWAKHLQEIGSLGAGSSLGFSAVSRHPNSCVATAATEQEPKDLLDGAGPEWCSPAFLQCSFCTVPERPLSFQAHRAPNKLSMCHLFRFLKTCCLKQLIIEDP